MGLFGGPSGSSGSGGGSTANVFTPPNQSGAAQDWQNLINPLLGIASGGGVGTPAGQVYPSAFNLVEQYLTGGLGGNNPATPFNTMSGNALNAANTAAQFGNQMFPLGAGAALSSATYAPAILNAGFNPAYGNITNAVSTNPFYSGALGGALQGYGMGGAGASTLQGAGNQIFQTGFDPQNALFNRTQQQLMDQTNVANTMAGVGNTPYGASVMSNALGNFDINWQNNLLKREGLASTFGAPLLQAAPGLAASSAALPSNVFLGQQNAATNALNNQLNAAVTGGTGFNNMTSGALGLGSNAANLLTSLSAGPYNLGGTIANNALSGLNNLVNLGNNQYLLPQELLQNLQQYMRLGQFASQISGNLGQMGFNQLSQGLGGALSAGNMLFGGGSGGLFGGGGGGLLGGLFGGGLAAGGDVAGLTGAGPAFLSAAGDFGGPAIAGDVLAPDLAPLAATASF